MTVNRQGDVPANKVSYMDKEVAHTIGAVAIAIISAFDDAGYNAAVETLHRYACDESRTERQRSLFGSLVHVLTAPLEQQAREVEEFEKRQLNFTVITGCAA